MTSAPIGSLDQLIEHGRPLTRVHAHTHTHTHTPARANTDKGSSVQIRALNPNGVADDETIAQMRRKPGQSHDHNDMRQPRALARRRCYTDAPCAGAQCFRQRLVDRLRLRNLRTSGAAADRVAAFVWPRPQARGRRTSPDWLVEVFNEYI
jgi:hypothetical protein